MPIITVYTDHPTRPYVRVEVNWADVPTVEHAAVSRVDVATGECVELRPYVCYDGWELLLSCGHGTFWDTEAPFDRPFYYITTSSDAPCLSAAAIVSDTFQRVVPPNGWGTADTGQTWTPTLPAGSTAQVDGSRGVISVDNDNETVYMSIPVADGSYTGSIQFFTPAVATGSVLVFEVDFRVQDASNYLFVQALPNTDNTILCRVGEVIGGATTLTQAVATTPYANNVAINVEWELDGMDLRLQVWSAAFLRPGGWLLEMTGVGISELGDLRVRMGTSAGSTSLPVTLYADNLVIEGSCRPCEPLTVDTSTTPTILANDGGFWLKDPVRPCNDQPVPLCAATAPVLPACAGGDGDLTFVEIGAEIYADNSYRLRPMNRSRAISVSRPRSDVTTSLVMEATTFTARDEALALAAPGTPLLFQGPSEYGVPDRYMAVGPVNVERQVSDHRIQFRKITMPYEAVDRPAGPSQGICGARVVDICDLYPTWDDLAAAGFTWDDLVRGAASPESANPDRRTWDDVNAEFVDWDAVNSGGRTWTGLLEGD